jgi:hypothetical protein
MKMIRHDAITNDFTMLFPFIPDFFYKENIVTGIKKNSTFFISPVVNMVNFIRDKMHIGNFR